MELYSVVNSGGFIETHPFFKKRNNKLGIPDKYRELYLDFKTSTLEYNEASIEFARQIYIQSFYINHWYSDESNITSITAPSLLFNFDSLDTSNLPNMTPWHKGRGMFVRLNSVSPKYRKPVYDIKEALNVIENSNRCLASIATAREYDFPLMLILREFRNFEHGCEYRAFVYHDKLTAICLNDDKIPTHSDGQVIERVRQVWLKSYLFQPFEDVVLDVFIHDTAQCEDQLIEFNSFGSWANASSGRFHWLEDEYELKDGSCEHKAIIFNIFKKKYRHIV